MAAHGLRCGAPGSIDLDRLADAARYEMILKAELESADQQRQAVVAEVLKRREVLVAADRDVRRAGKTSRDATRSATRGGRATGSQAAR